MSLSSKLLNDLATQHGTPLYVYDGDLVVQRYKELSEFISYPKLKILYAMKSNYNPELLKLLNSHGAYLDTVSPGEVLLALKLGFSKDRLLYTANNITDKEMHQVHDLGVVMNIGSLSRLEKFAKAFPGSSVCLRFNPAVVAGHHAKVQTGGDLTKFGILLDDVDRAANIAKTHNLKVIGLHKHTGSGIRETEKFIQSANNVLEIATKERFPELEFLDFGGGFAVPYSPDETPIDYRAFGKAISERFTAWCKEYGKDLELFFEPGRYVSAEAGTMLVRVNTLKDNHGRKIAGTDSGFPQLIRPMFYDSYHHIVNLSNPDGEHGEYDICGNICETGDLFAAARDLPEVREGDLLAIQNAGAYCYAMGGIYNLRPMPEEVIVINSEAKVARRRLSSEELVESILGECQ